MPVAGAVRSRTCDGRRSETDCSISRAARRFSERGRFEPSTGNLAAGALRLPIPHGHGQASWFSGTLSEDVRRLTMLVAMTSDIRSERGNPDATPSSGGSVSTARGRIRGHDTGDERGRDPAGSPGVPECQSRADSRSARGVSGRRRGELFSTFTAEPWTTAILCRRPSSMGYFPYSHFDGRRWSRAPPAPLPICSEWRRSTARDGARHGWLATTPPTRWETAARCASACRDRPN